jgi:periplasmic protein TonB
MATLLESGAKPYGSSKGMLVSMLLHGALITAAVAGTAKVVLPPREKVEEHPILYVASPPPKPVQMAEPLPETKAPPKAKAPAKVFHAPPPRAQAPRPQPVMAKVPATPALVAPTRVAVSLPAVDLKVAPTIGDVVAPPAPDVIGKAGGISREGSVKSDGEDGGGGGKGGLGSGSSRAYDENQVERAVQVTRKAEPRYPEALKSVGVEGVVQMHFIVGADGRVEPGSIEVISTPHKLFADAVRTALLNTRYRPAEAGGHSVRQLVEQSFTFRLEK